MRFWNQVRCGMFNVRGLNGSVGQVAALREQKNVVEIILTETWIKTSKAMPLSWCHESACIPQPTGIRGIGGVSVVLRPVTIYKLLEK